MHVFLVPFAGSLRGTIRHFNADFGFHIVHGVSLGIGTVCALDGYDQIYKIESGFLS